MITPLSIANNAQNPYIEAKIQHITNKGLVFGEWLAPSNKLEEVIVNMKEGEEHVLDKLYIGMTVHVRQPRPNTRPGAQTAWRCFMRGLDEQPIYLQQSCGPKFVEPEVVKAAIPEPVQVPLQLDRVDIGRRPRVTINEDLLVDYVAEWASAGNYTTANAASKAVMDIIRAAMRAGLKAE